MAERTTVKGLPINTVDDTDLVFEVEWRGDDTVLVASKGGQEALRMKLTDAIDFAIGLEREALMALDTLEGAGR